MEAFERLDFRVVVSLIRRVYKRKINLETKRGRIILGKEGRLSFFFFLFFLGGREREREPLEGGGSTIDTSTKVFIQIAFFFSFFL